MELRMLVSYFLGSFLFLLYGYFMWHNPSFFGGEFKLTRTLKFYSISYIKSSNDFVIRNTRIIGVGFIVSGFLVMIFAIAYSFYPLIMVFIKNGAMLLSAYTIH